MPQTFHFVPPDSAQKYASETRKHVQRGIGEAKRKGKPPRRRQYARFDLAWRDDQQPPQGLVDDISTPELSEEQDDQSSWSDAVTLRKTNPRSALGESRMPGISTLVNGSPDPFLVYPVELAPRARMLLGYMLDPKNMLLRSFRITWYPLLWTGDIAVFYQALSNSCTALVRLHRLRALL
jgi:hypothetical protein